MKATTVLLCVSALLCCLFAGASMWAQSDQRSLGDVARQKSAAKAKRVVTNDEIPPSPEANNPPASSPAVSGSSGPDAAKPGANGGARKDGDKTAASAEGATALQRLLAERDGLERVIKKMQDKIAATDDPSRVESLRDVLEQAKHQLAENQQAIDKLKAGGGAAPQRGDAPPPPSAPATPAEQTR